jgi:hypothetical protein
MTRRGGVLIQQASFERLKSRISLGRKTMRKGKEAQEEPGLEQTQLLLSSREMRDLSRSEALKELASEQDPSAKASG